MSESETELESIRSVFETGQHAVAENRLRTLIDNLSVDGLATSKEAVELMIDMFQRKRRLSLTKHLHERVELLRGATSPSQSISSLLALDAEVFEERLRGEFADLGDHNIFDWTHAYLSKVREWFNELVPQLAQDSTKQDLLFALQRQSAQHAKEIFHKGFTFKQKDQGVESALNTAARGASRFMEVPLIAYSENILQISSSGEARSARSVCSAMLSGILRGFARAELGSIQGEKLLPQVQWPQKLPYLTSIDFASIEPLLTDPSNKGPLRAYAMPLCLGIDEVLASGPQELYFTLQDCQYHPSTGLIDITFGLPDSAMIPELRVGCYLKTVRPGALEQLLNRGFALILAPILEADFLRVRDENIFDERVIDTGADSAGPNRAMLVKEHLRAELAKCSTQSDSEQAIEVNYAEYFPLEKGSVDQTHYVERPSVRALLPTVSQYSGVRLWTSLRRSGKTTSCLRLARDEDIVFQTCLPSGQSPWTGIFLKQIENALDSHTRVSDRFISELIGKCAGREIPHNSRVVFVLDEYETLFETIETAVEFDRSAQNRVGLPILNQLLEFARTNMVLMIGQRPDAHYILMERNQLSPCIEHEPFPLFAHGSAATRTEFVELIEKALTSRIPFDAEFANCVFQETQGHPYLTVNLLLDFVDWLIRKKYPIHRQVTEEIFVDYATDCLSPERIVTSTRFEFFRRLIGDYLNVKGRKMYPWLHAVHSLFRQMPENDLSVSRTYLNEVADREILARMNVTLNELLLGASNANFLRADGDRITPGVPIAARIAQGIPF